MDGFAISYLPAGVGGESSDFGYEWEGVRFACRLWERRLENGYRVDLQVIVLRGRRLTSRTALRDFLAGYHERDATTWALTEFRHGDSIGLLGEAEAFWLDEPGVAVEVRVDPQRFDATELRAVALGVRKVRPGRVAGSRDDA